MYIFNTKEIKKKIHLALDSFFGTNHHYNHRHHNDNNDNKKDDNNKQPTQKETTLIDITVIDIKKTLEQNRIQCITKPMKEINYITISYRWGELQEQIVPTTVYKSHVTSFAIQDFYLLCQLLQKEQDLQQVPYVWVDTISIDQQNIVQRKATIRHMDQIYEQASFIIAVPDLHYAHLSVNSANHHHFQLIKKHSNYMYHSMMLAYYQDHPNENKNKIHYHEQSLHDIETKWIYHWLTNYQRNNNSLIGIDDDDDDNNIISSFQLSDMNDQHQLMLNLISTNIDFTKLIHLPSQIPWHHFNSTDSFSTNTNDNIEQQQQVYSRGRQYLNSIFGNDKLDDILEQQLFMHNNINVEQRKLLKDIQLQRCKQLSKQYESELQMAYDFLQFLINDWSNRAWVISEYHIAKKKISTPMKLLFLSMDWQSILDYHEKDQTPLFFWNLFDNDNLLFKNKTDTSNQHNNNDNDNDNNNDNNNDTDDEDKDEETLLPATTSSEDYYKASIISPLYTNYKLHRNKSGWRIMGKLFWKKVNDRLGKRECLDMILNSKATKNQDRYFAILPLWKKYFNRVITNQTIMEMEITDLVSVRLNLFEWMDLDDKVCLLHACSMSSLLSLPSFVTYYNQNGLVINELYEDSSNIKLKPTLKSQPLQLKTSLCSIIPSNSSSTLPPSLTTTTTVSYSYTIPQMIETDKIMETTIHDNIILPFQLKKSAKKFSYSQYNNNNNTSTHKSKNSNEPILSAPCSSVPISAPCSSVPISAPIVPESSHQHKAPRIVKSLPIEATLPTDDDDDGIIPNVLDITLDNSNKSIPKLLLKVKKYYKNENEKLLNMFYDKWSFVLVQHDLQWKANELKFITIPLFVPSQDKSTKFSSSCNHLSLIGHPKQNKWVLYRYNYNQSDIGLSQYQDEFTGPYNTELNENFIIY
ncbi:unnamed protein product [Cunninghamella echinulata]